MQNSISLSLELKTARSRKPWALIVMLGIAALIAFAPLPYSAVTPTQRHYRIEARSFEFTPATLYANAGDVVTVEIVSTDVVHGFMLDGYDVNITAEPGQTTSVTFTADNSGVFRFRCPVACGQLHPFMTGKLQVGPNLLLVRAAALGILAVVSALWILR
jgi:heme/copper-type cytochrome/quinol oxidase subunit 2